MFDQDNKNISVDSLATLINIDGFTNKEVDIILERLSLEFNGVLYNYRFVPDINMFVHVIPPYKSKARLPTEKEVLYAVSKMEKLMGSYFKMYNKDGMNTNTFETTVHSIVGKTVSGVPILNYLINEGLVIKIEDIIKWI